MRAEPFARSLAQRFTWAAAWLTGGALVVLALASWAWAEHLHELAVRQMAQRDLHWHASRAADALVRIEARLRETAASPLLQTALTDSSARTGYLQPHLESLRTIDGVPVQLEVVDFEGQPISGPSDFPPSSREHAWFVSDLAAQGTRVTLAQVDGQPQVWLALGIVFARSGTVEGFLWASLRLADLPHDDDYRLVAGDTVAARDADRRARLQLPAPLAELPLVIERDGALPPVPRNYTLIGVFASAALLLVVAAGFAARWVARSLTRDLAQLERFAGQVALDSVSPGRAPTGGPQEVASLASSINRMLERLRRQHEALESQSQQQLNLLATCIANLGDAVIITEITTDGAGPRFPIVFVNPAFERMTGYAAAEVLGRSPAFLQGPDTDAVELQRLNAALRRREAVRVELLNYTRGGERYWVELEVVPVLDDAGEARYFVAIERDTTQRRALEEQLRQAQKMEAIGTLAGGIAHDFNNVLAAILGNVALAQQDLRASRPVDDWIRQIGRSAERARGLVQQILAFSRRRPQVRAPQELGSLLGETVGMLRATVPAGVSIVLQRPDEAVVVEGDATSIGQVLLNLGTNAWQALEGHRGEIVFGLEVEASPSGPPCAHLWVRDDGCGIDEATQRRIFEPYFTTKPIGRGTGLGLAVVEGIVREHGGHIGVQSQPGMGSTFHIRLPLAAGGVATPAVAGPPAAARSLQARVLYVDDDEVLGVVVGALLDRWGCTVTTVKTAEEALATVRADPTAVDVVVSDFNMPGASGLELAVELRILRRDLPIVLTSGHVTDELLAAVRVGTVQAVLGKEQLHDALHDALHDVLARGAAAAPPTTRPRALDPRAA